MGYVWVPDTGGRYKNERTYEPHINISWTGSRSSCREKYCENLIKITNGDKLMSLDTGNKYGIVC